MSRRTKGLDTMLQNKAKFIHSVTSQVLSMCLGHGWLLLILLLAVPL